MRKLFDDTPQNMVCKAINEPIPTITAHANHFAKTDVYLKEYDGDNLGHWNEIRELLNTYTDWNISANQVLIFCINGVEYFISDITDKKALENSVENAAA